MCDCRCCAAAGLRCDCCRCFVLLRCAADRSPRWPGLLLTNPLLLHLLGFLLLRRWRASLRVVPSGSNRAARPCSKCVARSVASPLGPRDVLLARSLLLPVARRLHSLRACSNTDVPLRARCCRRPTSTCRTASTPSHASRCGAFARCLSLLRVVWQLGQFRVSWCAVAVRAAVANPLDCSVLLLSNSRSVRQCRTSIRSAAFCFCVADAVAQRGGARDVSRRRLRQGA